MAAPMQNLWTDELQDFLQYPIGLAHAAVAEGKHYDVIYSEMAMSKAACNGKLDVIKFLHEERNAECSTYAMYKAARFGCTTYAMDAAARHGHFDVVKFLHENRTEGCTADAIDNAASRGHLDIVIFLLENRSEGCTTDAMKEAVAQRHLNHCQIPP
ncbi:ankyrin repeat [Thraustotheca clavata]|uniref:Ankyrin repeat n=1 Tax=Thraustotheca clavata TaxID=74557 RepID=A0A1W0A641_9STRA|nr:ankyrin repeat [Thraustotheca clavata]